MAKETKEVVPELGDPISQNWIEKAQAEIRSNSRIIEVKNFRGQEECQLIVSKPNLQQDTLCSNRYSKYFNRYLNDPDFKTNIEMEESMEKRGIWGKKQEEQIEKYRDEMTSIAIDVCTIRDNKDTKSRIRLEKFKAKWLELRDKIQELAVKKQSFLSNTVEAKADEEKIKLKLSLCVKFQDGTLVWESIEALDQETDQINLSNVITEAMVFWSGLSTEIINSLPDHIFAIGEDVDQRVSKK